MIIVEKAAFIRICLTDVGWKLTPLCSVACVLPVQFCQTFYVYCSCVLSWRPCQLSMGRGKWMSMSYRIYIEIAHH